MKNHVPGHVVHGVVADTKAGGARHVPRAPGVFVAGTINVRNPGHPVRGAGSHAHVNTVGRVGRQQDRGIKRPGHELASVPGEILGGGLAVNLGKCRSRDSADANDVGFHRLRFLSRSDLVRKGIEQDIGVAGGKRLALGPAGHLGVTPPLVRTGHRSEIRDIDTVNRGWCGAGGHRCRIGREGKGRHRHGCKD